MVLWQHSCGTGWIRPVIRRGIILNDMTNRRQPFRENPFEKNNLFLWDRLDSNQRPRDYESPALPLSYGPWCDSSVVPRGRIPACNALRSSAGGELPTRRFSAFTPRYPFSCCAEGENRTPDTKIFSLLLYRLSYLG